jgi:uncharacterized protein DUF4824
MLWPAKWTAAAGLGLIAAVNAWVLVGVAYNRGGEPESALRLTDRELSVPRPRAFQKENSGLSLRLLWRVRDEENEARGFNFGYGGIGGRATWLNEAKLRDLGIQVPPKSASDAEKRRYRKLGSKEALLVLEFDGPAYRAVLERARERANAPPAPGKQGPQAAELPAKLLRYEEQDSSRLFVIDAGLDAATLRAKYPDRARYAIVKGRVRPLPSGYGKTEVGMVEALSVDSVNVPLELRSVFEGVTPRPYYAFGQPSPPGPGFEAAVVFGKRLEPWLTVATRKP